jgi:F0F1-type ATP synthase assembly protein I
MFLGFQSPTRNDLSLNTLFFFTFRTRGFFVSQTQRKTSFIVLVVVMEKNVAYNNDDDYPRTDANGVFVVSGRKPRDRVWGIIFGLVVLSTLLIGGINYHAYADLVKSEGIPKPSEMEYGQACDGPLFKSKLEANNERYKVANASPYSRRKLMEDGNKITRRRRRESLGPDGPDVLFPERLGVSEFTENNDENNNNNNNNNAAHLAKTKKLSFNSDEPFDVTVVINAALWCAGLSLLVSVLMGMFIVFMFRTCAHKTVWGIIYFKIFALYAMALAMLNMGSLEGFIIFALIGSLTWFVYWLWTDELNVVASMLAVSSQALKDNPGIIWFVLLLQVAVMVFVVPVVGFIYVAELGGLPDVNPKAIYQNSSTLACADYVGRPVNCCATTPGAWVAWYEALAIIAMIWAFAFALETRMYVIGGTVCQWYFAPKGTKSFRGFTLTSTKHALGPSFGTVSFGSAIMTAVEMMRQAMERAREDNEQNIFLCLVQSCLECIWEFIEYLSKFAMLQASMTGEAFCDAASSIFDLLKRNFLLAYGTYAFPSMILQILSLVFALLAAAGSYAINFALFEVAEVSMAPLYAIVCAIITGVVVWCSLSYFTMILVNTTDAVFVCYAKDKDRNEIHHEEMHAVFENAIQRRQEARGEIVRQPAGPYAYGAGNTVNKSY